MADINNELEPIAFRHDGFLVNDEKEYLLKSEVLELIKNRETALLSRIKEAGPQLRKRKPTHGNCCTCQDCGFGHDECECSWNGPVIALHRTIDNIAKEIRGENETTK